MRKPTIYLASLVILTSVIGTSSAKSLTHLARPTSACRSIPIGFTPSQRAAAKKVLIAPTRPIERIGKPGRQQLAIKAKREFLKAAISFERYRIAQRKFPLKSHDQFEILPSRPSDATWSVVGDYSKLVISEVEALQA